VLKLIELEMKKFKISRYIIAAIICTLAIFGVSYLIIFSKEMLGVPFSAVYEIVKIFANSVFLVFGAVMLAKVIISEYEKGTITLLYTYPINRKLIILSKIVLVGAFVVISSIIANVFVMLMLYTINVFDPSITMNLTRESMTTIFIKVLVNSLAFACMNSISLFFGLLKKSGITTIITSIILISVVGSSNNGASLSNYIIIPLSLGLLGVIATYFILKGVEERDVV
jgi:ABC-type transport system involved in multi-copper enzyme maturation permease subunit